MHYLGIEGVIENAKIELIFRHAFDLESISPLYQWTMAGLYQILAENYNSICQNHFYNATTLSASIRRLCLASFNDFPY